MSKLSHPFLRLDFERDFEDELCDMKTTLDKDFSKHSAHLAQQSSESVARLTKQLNDLQFANEEKLAKHRRLVQALNRAESGLKSMGSLSSSILTSEKLDELMQELNSLKDDKLNEDMLTEQADLMNKALRQQITDRKRSHEKLQDKFANIDKHSETLENAKQAAHNTLHESVFQFTQAKQKLQEIARQRNDLLELKRVDLSVLKDENQSLIEKMTKLSLKATQKDKQNRKLLQTLKATVDDKSRRMLANHELASKIENFEQAFSTIKLAVKRFDPKLEWVGSPIPCHTVSNVLISLQKNSDSLQQAYFSMAEGRQNLSEQFHNLSVQLKAESQKDFIDDLKFKEQTLIQKVSHLSYSVNTCNQVLSSVESVTYSPQLTVEVAEKLVMTLFFSFLAVIFRTTCSVSHIVKYSDESTGLHTVKDLGKAIMQALVGLVMSDSENLSPSPTVRSFGIKAPLFKLTSPENLSADYRNLLEFLEITLDNPSQASSLADLVTSVPFLKSFLMKSDLDLLKLRATNSKQNFMRETVQLIHSKITDKYAAAVRDFQQMLQNITALLAKGTQDYENLDAPKELKLKAYQKLALQPNSMPKVVDHSSIVRMAMAFSMEKLRSFQGTNERLKSEFESYVNKYKVITQKAPVKETPLKRQLSHISLQTTPIDHSIEMIKPRKLLSTKSEDHLKSKSTLRSPKFLQPIDKGPATDAKEARSIKLDLDNIKRKEREVKKGLASFRIIKSPRKLEPLSNSARRTN